jgi:hypothetical protein
VDVTWWLFFPSFIVVVPKPQRHAAACPSAKQTRKPARGFACLAAKLSPRVFCARKVRVAAAAVIIGGIPIALVLFNSPLELRAKAKIGYAFYRHSRETNQFLHSNASVNRQNYIRILILACVDIFLTLPIGIITIIGQVITSLLIPNPSPEPRYPFYFGWDFIHSDWDPEVLPYSEVVESGRWAVTGLYFESWISPVLAVTTFAPFDLTSEARATYWRGICAVGRLVGWEPPMR